MSQQDESVLGKIEKAFGLPSLSKVAETMQKFPDSAQLKLIKEVLEISERLSKSSMELEKVIALVKEVKEIPAEKLADLEKVLKRIEAIVKKTPNEILDFLTSLKEK